MEVFKLRLVSTLSYKTSFQIRPVQIKYVANRKLKVKNFLSFSVSYIFAIIIIIIIIIIMIIIIIIAIVMVKKRVRSENMFSLDILKDLEISTLVKGCISVNLLCRIG